MWMNGYEIEEAAERFGAHPVLGPATLYLQTFKNEVNEHSDGWPYWSAPAKAADKLMNLIHSNLRAGMGAYPNVEAPTLADVKKAIAPIKAFYTRRGKAAGMKEPELRG
jgi:hypothetical protein